MKSLAVPLIVLCGCPSGQIFTPPAQVAPERGVAAGFAHTCRLDEDGAVACFGSNMNGQLGTADGAGTFDVDVDRVGIPALPGAAQRVFAGGQATCAQVDLALWCWGENGEDTGAVIETVRPEPALVAVPPLSQVDLGVAGTSCGVAYGDEEAGVWCWGGLENGLRGPDATSFDPERVDVPTAEEVHVGGYFACSRGEGITCWGCTDPAADPPCSEPGDPVVVEGTDAMVEFDVGRAQACGRDEAGDVRCWGQNLWGGMGVEEPLSSVVPVPVDLPRPARRLALGWDFGCATLDDDTVACWGYCLGGFGDGPAGPATACPAFGNPPTVLPLTGVTAIAAGGAHACAVKADGTTWCWGANAAGQLGDGTATDAFTTVVQVTVAPP